MEHVVIMRRSWGMLPKILTGKKTIESRWYKKKSAPWGKITGGETVYFKNSGEKVSAKATIKEIKTFDNLNPAKVKEILKNYGEEDGIELCEVDNYFNLFKDKKYCLLIFLKNPEKIAPFEINKKGFGAIAAWICTENIEKIKTRVLL